MKRRNLSPRGFLHDQDQDRRLRRPARL